MKHFFFHIVENVTYKDFFYVFAFFTFFALKTKTKTANLSENDYTVQTSFGKNAKFVKVQIC